MYTPCSTSQLEMRCSICVFCNKGSCLGNLDCTRWRSVAVNFSYLNIEEATILWALKLSRTSRFWSTTTDTNYKSSFYYKKATGTSSFYHQSRFYDWMFDQRRSSWLNVDLKDCSVINVATSISLQRTSTSSHDKYLRSEVQLTSTVLHYNYNIFIVINQYIWYEYNIDICKTLMWTFLWTKVKRTVGDRWVCATDAAVQIVRAWRTNTNKNTQEQTRLKRKEQTKDKREPNFLTVLLKKRSMII